MPQPISNQHALAAASRPMRAFAVAGGLFGAVILVGTLGLWARYGTAVFFDMITSGFAACF